MKKKNSIQKVIISFFTQLTLALSGVFFVHTFLLKTQKLQPYDHKIILAYLLNFLLAVIIFLALFILRKKYKDQLGFLFMFGSFLKFAVFFIFFYPSYNADGNTSKLEFFAFFIPYVIGLITETLALIKLLNLPRKEA